MPEIVEKAVIIEMILLVQPFRKQDPDTTNKSVSVTVENISRREECRRSGWS